MAGYTRNDTPNNIADGNVINASDLDGEFDAIQTAFGTGGHTHDGTAGNGPQIGTGGIANDAVTLGTKTSGNYVAAGAVSGVGLSGSASAEGATFTVASNATDANTASTIVARDASGNFNAGTITASLTGNADTATALQTARTIAGQTFDGTANITIASTDLSDGGSFIQGDVAATKTSGDFTFNDNIKATFGTSNDLQIFHTGSISVIADTYDSANLILSSSGFTFMNSGQTEVLMSAVQNGAVTLYYDNVSKLTTTSSGVTISGYLTTDRLSLGDGEYAYFGNSNDLRIFHNGLNSYIEDTGTGDLYIRGSDDIFIQSYPGENAITVNSNASVDLYYNGVLKLSTLSNGVDITGSIYVDDYIFHRGDTNTYLQFHASDQFRITTGGTEMLEVNNDYILLGSNTVGKVHTDTSQAGSQTPSFYVYNSFVWTLTGNLTLNNPSTEVTGMSGVFIFIQGGSGGYTISLGTDYETTDGQGLTLSTAAGSVDIVPYFVQSSGNILLGTPQLAFS